MDDVDNKIADLKRRLEFHDDSEVKWDMLHEAANGLDDPDVCASCGNDIYDDRWHLFYLVRPNNVDLLEQGITLSKIMHRDRRRIHEELLESSRKMLFGTITGFDRR